MILMVNCNIIILIIFLIDSIAVTSKFNNHAYYEGI